MKFELLNNFKLIRNSYWWIFIFKSIFFYRFFFKNFYVLWKKPRKILLMASLFNKNERITQFSKFFVYTSNLNMTTVFKFYIYNNFSLVHYKFCNVQFCFVLYQFFKKYYFKFFVNTQFYNFIYLFIRLKQWTNFFVTPKTLRVFNKNSWFHLL